MAGELHSPPDDGARARADAVEDEQVRADALADRIAAYAPAGSDLRATARALYSEQAEMEARALRAEAEVRVLRGILVALVPGPGDDGELLVPVAPEIAARLGADWSEPVQFRLVERGDGYEMILRKVTAEVERLRGMLSAHGLDPDCSLCAAGHAPGKPCGEPETFVWADGTIYDASIPGYREATVEERHRNVPTVPEPARPSADEPAIFRASGTVDFDWGPSDEPEVKP